ncbi:MAG: alkaline phosphatase family protein, partial [Planctomycetaceae bacterium]|nr:alkaline phosphatase family protein [Planctomycetaceae bacterium]
MIRRAGLTLILALAVVITVQPDPAHRHLLLVLDGLRPDYVTKDVMPNLYALAQRGVTFTNHHSVYPTVTRVNA